MELQPCNLRRHRHEFKFQSKVEVSERIKNSARASTPPSDSCGFESGKNEPRMIVLALYAPPLATNKKPTSKIAESKNLETVTHRKEQRRWPQPSSPPSPPIPAAAGTTAVSVYKIPNLSCCCCSLLPQSCRLKLSGCAVISKGILVVEGGSNSIRRYLRFLVRRKLEEKGRLSVRVVWQGRVEKPSFGKFSVLHCTNELAVCKFFADHGASLYWDIAVKSTTR